MSDRDANTGRGGGAGEAFPRERMAARRCRALGRRRRLATRAQRRALLARDGGCARSGCEETRIERLHAHHLTPWRLGGRTDVSAMVLLCDVTTGWSTTRS